MKKALLFSLSLMLSLPALAETVSVGVNGMVCSMCAQGIKKKFSGVGIKDVNVDLDKKIVELKTEKANEISDDKIKELIKESGYVVTTITRQ